MPRLFNPNPTNAQLKHVTRFAMRQAAAQFAPLVLDNQMRNYIEWANARVMKYQNFWWHYSTDAINLACGGLWMIGDADWQAAWEAAAVAHNIQPSTVSKVYNTHWMKQPVSRRATVTISPGAIAFRMTWAIHLDRWAGLGPDFSAGMAVNILGVLLKP
jgi:hypothetical protein